MITNSNEVDKYLDRVTKQVIKLFLTHPDCSRKMREDEEILEMMTRPVLHLIYLKGEHDGLEQHL